MVDKKGEWTESSIIGILLAAAAVFVMVILLFRLLMPTFDMNKEYAEGVYEKLEEAATEAKGGRGEFSILDVPVDFGDSVFLVLFNEKEYQSLSNYPVEIKNSGFRTYVEKSAVPAAMSTRRVYYSLLKSAGIADDIAKKTSEEVVEELALRTAANADDILFKIDMRQIVRNFVTTSKVEGVDPEKIIKEIIDNGVGKGLSPKEKLVELGKVLDGYLPAGAKKVGKYNNIGTFMSSAEALARGNTKTMLKNDLAFNLEAERVIRDFVGDENSVQALLKEVADETFGEGLDLSVKKGRLEGIINRNIDNAVGVEDALKGIDKKSGERALKLLSGSADDVSDDLVRAATNKILSVKAIPTEKATKELAEEILTSKGVSKTVVGGLWKMIPKGKITRLTFKAVGKIAGAAFIVWELYEYYTIAHDAKAWALLALNQDEVSKNEWLANKFLKAKKGKDDVLCVCYVNAAYTKNYCSDCISFDKEIVTNPDDKNYWTFCNDITLEERGNEVLLTANVREDCKPSIALTNTECEESREELKLVLNSVGNKFAGGAVSTLSATTYGAAMGVVGGVGGCFVGGVIGFFGGAGIGAVPGCGAGIVAGVKLGVVGGAAVGTIVGIQDVEFTCDERGHICMGKTTEGGVCG